MQPCRCCLLLLPPVRCCIAALHRPFPHSRQPQGGPSAPHLSIIAWLSCSRPCSWSDVAA